MKKQIGEWKRRQEGLREFKQESGKTWKQMAKELCPGATSTQIVAKATQLSNSASGSQKIRMKLWLELSKTFNMLNWVTGAEAQNDEERRLLEEFRDQHGIIYRAPPLLKPPRPPSKMATDDQGHPVVIQVLLNGQPITAHVPFETYQGSLRSDIGNITFVREGEDNQPAVRVHLDFNIPVGDLLGATLFRTT